MISSDRRRGRRRCCSSIDEDVNLDPLSRQSCILYHHVGGESLRDTGERYEATGKRTKPVHRSFFYP